MAASDVICLIPASLCDHSSYFKLEAALGLKVSTVEVTENIPDIDLADGEEGLFCLVTYQNCPVGDITIRSAKRRLSADLLKEKIASELGDAIIKKHFQFQLEEPQKGFPHRMTDHRGNLPTVSVVVCTRDRPEDLRRCLQSLRTLTYPHIEVLVVDNASKTDETRLAALDLGVRYVREEKPGLDFARNRGIIESQGTFVAFADDDVLVDINWVAELLRGFEDESIVCVTGLTMPAELVTEAQILFESYGSGGFRKGYQKMIFDRINLPPSAAGKIGAGANMVFRREFFDIHGLFDEALDCGTPAKAGGDLDIFYRILAAGYRILYQPTALVWHRHRKTMDELERQLYGYGVAVYAFLTKCVLEYKDLKAFGVGVGWFRYQLGGALRSQMGRGIFPARLTIRELMGGFRGPTSYFAGQSYASKIRSNEGEERRGPLGRDGDASGTYAQLFRAARRLNWRNRSWEHA